MKNAVSWFEIGTQNLSRAQNFYEDIFQIKMEIMEFPNIKMCLFPIDDPSSGAGGALVYTEGFHVPSSSDGPLIYLNANPDVQKILDRVEPAGGKIVVPKTSISPEFGSIGVIIDSEGNRIALHSV